MESESRFKGLFKSKIVILALIAGLLVTATGIVFAVNFYASQNSVIVTPNSSIPILTVSVNSTSPNIGDIIRLTGTLSNPLNDIPITFYNNATGTMTLIGDGNPRYSINGIAHIDFLITSNNVLNCTAYFSWG